MSTHSRASQPPDPYTNGIVLLQGFLQYFCQGIIFAQALKFWKRSSNDTMYLRCFVALLVLLACLQTAISSYKVWVMAINQKHWWTSPLCNVDFFVNGLVCIICETYLIRRCWKFSQRNTWVLISLGALATVALVSNIYLAVKIGHSIGSEPEYSNPLRSSTWAFPLWVYDSLALVLATTSILSFYLWKSKTGYSHLDKTLRNIISITWESATLPCIFMIVSGTLYFSSRKSESVRHWDTFFILNTGKFYTHGLLRTLNSREKFRDSFNNHQDVGRQDLGSWLSSHETKVDSVTTERGRKDSNATHSDNTEAQGTIEDVVPTPASSRPSSGTGDMVFTSPEIEARERGIIVRNTDFVIVN